MRRILLGFAALTGLLACTPAVWAETVYVDDVLRVGVREKPNSVDAPVAVVATGTALEVLKRREGYVRVRTKEGVEGWIKDVYVADQVPARQRLEEVVADQKRLKEALAQQRTTADGAEKESARLKQRLTKLEERNELLQGQLNQARTRLAVQTSRNRWLYAGAAIIVLFLLGFLAGVRWYRQRIAGRLGGFHI